MTAEGKRTEDETRARRTRAPTMASGLGRLGWLLVAAIAVVLLGIPTLLLVLPESPGVLDALGLSLRDAYLTIPLVAAMLFGLIAVWAAVRARQA